MDFILATDWLTAIESAVEQTTTEEKKVCIFSESNLNKFTKNNYRRKM
jgi:hypothetical protein